MQDEQHVGADAALLAIVLMTSLTSSRKTSAMGLVLQLQFGVAPSLSIATPFGKIAPGVYRFVWSVRALSLSLSLSLGQTNAGLSVVEARASEKARPCSSHALTPGSTS
jgi:hypothetical protein